MYLLQRDHHDHQRTKKAKSTMSINSIYLNVNKTIIISMMGIHGCARSKKNTLQLLFDYWMKYRTQGHHYHIITIISVSAWRSFFFFFEQYNTVLREWSPCWLHAGYYHINNLEVLLLFFYCLARPHWQNPLKETQSRDMLHLNRFTASQKSAAATEPAS